jgi:hypothetical protein
MRRSVHAVVGGRVAAAASVSCCVGSWLMVVPGVGADIPFSRFAGGSCPRRQRPAVVHRWLWCHGKRWEAMPSDRLGSPSLKRSPRSGPNPRVNASRVNGAHDTHTSGRSQPTFALVGLSPVVLFMCPCLCSLEGAPDERQAGGGTGEVIAQVCRQEPRRRPVVSSAMRILFSPSRHRCGAERAP